MCGRFTLASSPAPLLRQLQLPFDEAEFRPRYNVAPSQEVLAVAAEAGTRPGVTMLRWGLIPHWADDPARVRGGLINARGETVAEKPSFRTPWRRRRCLVLADGFYEWKGESGGKQPYRIVRKDRQPFPLAGLWDRWQGPAGVSLKSCTIITTEAGPALAAIHPRMPVILKPADCPGWLDVDGAPPARLKDLLRPYPDAELEAYPVSPRVNRASEDSPAVIEPLRA